MVEGNKPFPNAVSPRIVLKYADWYEGKRDPQALHLRYLVQPDYIEAVVLPEDDYKGTDADGFPWHVENVPAAEKAGAFDLFGRRVHCGSLVFGQRGILIFADGSKV